MAYDYDDSEKGYDHKLDKATRQIVGAGDHEVVDLTDVVDYVEPEIKNCRYFEVDVEGVIKIAYLTNDKSQLKIAVLNALPGINRYRCIKRVYKNYKANTECFAQAYTEEGELVKGIRVIR